MADSSSAVSPKDFLPEPVMEETAFEGDGPTSTVWIKWDVKGGRDRTHNANLNTNYWLEGSPNIQGIEIKSSIPVAVECFGGEHDNTPDIVLEGPTNGKHKITPRRLGAYRVKAR